MLEATDVSLSWEQRERLACDYAEHVLSHWESVYPRDRRPRCAIEAKRAWIDRPMLDEVQGEPPAWPQPLGSVLHAAWDASRCAQAAVEFILEEDEQARVLAAAYAAEAAGNLAQLDSALGSVAEAAVSSAGYAAGVYGSEAYAGGCVREVTWQTTQWRALLKRVSATSSCSASGR